MDYNTKIWDEYTDENTESIQENLSKFMFNSVLILGGKRVLEVGCNIGNNLSEFPVDFDVNGLDMNEKALDRCKEKYPSFKFKKASVLEIPFPDSSFDVVFTRGVLIHISPEDIEKSMTELLRVSKKWIFNLEYFGEDNKMIKWKRGDDLLWYRNMKERWKSFRVEIITDVELPEKIDSGKTKFTLVRKL